MRKNSSTLLLALIIALTVFITATTTTANAEENGKLKIKFRALAVGQCLIGYGKVNPGWPIPTWTGIGRGSTMIIGKAEVKPYENELGPMPPWFEDTDVYISGNIKAIGYIVISWTEEDGKHMLLARLYSTSTTQGIFIPEKDQFVIQLESVEDALKFEAIYITPSGRQRMKGIAKFVAAQLAPPEDYPTFISVYLVTEDLQQMFSALWTPEEMTVTLGTETFTIPAAKVYQRNVKL